MGYEINLIGYGPDIDSTTTGIITNCTAWIPSTKGMEAAPGEASLSIAALAAECRGAGVIIQLDETNRFLAGTTTKLYEEGSGTWSEIYDATSTPLGAAQRWDFAAFGNIELAIAPTVPMIGSASGAMSTITKGGQDAPAGRSVETVGDFVFVFNYDSVPDGWYCSALGDHTDWTPNISTQCANGRLYGTPGHIVGGKRFGEGIVAYKKNSMYLGVYEGPPLIWRWIEIPGNVGALCNEAIVNVGTPEEPRHFFMGSEDFWMFDGVKPMRIGTPVRETVFSEMNRAVEDQCYALHDRVNTRIYFYYPTTETYYPNKCVVYNYNTNSWGRDDRIIHAAINYISPGVTYGNLGGEYTTYGDLPSLSYGRAFYTANASIPAIFDSTDTPKSLSGTPGTSTFTLENLGDDTRYSLLQRVKPRYLTAPTTAQLTNSYKYNIGDSFTTDKTTNEVSERFDVYREARWHKAQFSFTGPCEFNKIIVDAEVSGDE